ncbi:MAG: TolC family protein [Verrucomicrobia bacterium]|nr:TolC family protein [Verrucomicrobiota bacterium]
MLLGCGCLAGFSSGAADSSTRPQSLTLESAIQLALEGNPELRGAAARVDAAAGRAHQSKLWSNPELTLSAEDWVVKRGDGFSDSKQMAGLGQTIPFPGKKRLDRQIGVSGVRLSEAALSLRRVELIRDVKVAFCQVLAAERLLGVAGELVKVSESSAATARKRVAAGAAADQEQLRAEIPLEQARTELSSFEREAAAARQTLALLLGRPDLSEVPVSGALLETADLALLARDPAEWLPTHPALVEVETGRSRAELELRRAQLEPYPDVRVDVAGGRIGESGESIVQLGLSVPLPIIDRAKGKKQEARANVRIAEAERAAVEQRLLRDWGTVSRRYRTAAEQVASYRERILPKATEALRLVRTGFEQGKFGFIDLLDTQRTTAEVRLAYQHRLLELNIARAELEALTFHLTLPGRTGDPSQPTAKP